MPYTKRIRQEGDLIVISTVYELLECYLLTTTTLSCPYIIILWCVRYNNEWLICFYIRILQHYQQTFHQASPDDESQNWITAARMWYCSIKSHRPVLMANHQSIQGSCKFSNNWNSMQTFTIQSNINWIHTIHYTLLNM